MKSLLAFVASLLLLWSTHLYAQNKTLGVGVTVPNPNAALDVDSPTGNQGLLLPRLTSAQITALGLVLGAADKGMMVYNKDTDNLIIWNGVAFGISVAASSTNANAAVFGTTTGTGPAGIFQNTNAANTSSALYGVTNGSGNALAIRGDITNAANTAAAVYGSTVGSGVGLYGISTGTGAAIQGYTTTGATAIYGQRDGATNGNAGIFSITNAANTSSSLVATTIGAGAAGSFQINNTGNNSPVLTANTNGNGSAASFTITQGTSTVPAVNISHAGTGNAITANRPIQATSFIGNGSALTGLPGLVLPYTGSSGTAGNTFSITNSSTSGSAGDFSNTGSNTSPTVNVSNSGNGSGVNIQQNTIGSALNITSTAGSSSASIAVNNAGAGASLAITQSNAGSSPVITINNTGGAGNAITANRPIQATSFVGDGSALTGVLPSGIIMPFAGTTTPTGYLICDGSAVSRVTYAALFAAIGTNWGVGDGSTTFNLPDLRGRFMRGVDGAAGNDPDAATRTATNGGNAGNNVGSNQQDDFKGHTHTSNDATDKTGGYSAVGIAGSLWFAGTSQATTSNSGGNETRPKNVNVNYIIKF